jgi:hypothetical protein
LAEKQNQDSLWKKPTMNSDFKTLPKGTNPATTNSVDDDFKYHLIPLYTIMWMLNLLLPFKYIGGVMYIAHYMRKDHDKIDWTKLGVIFILSPSIWDIILITFVFLLFGFVMVTCPFWCGPVICIAVLAGVFIAFCCFQGEDGLLNQIFGGFTQV